MKQMSNLGRMFVYCSLIYIKGNKLLILDELSESAQKLVIELDKYNAVQLQSLGDRFVISMGGKGLELMDRYLIACADELRAGHFGKMHWDKYSKFHRDILKHIDTEEWINACVEHDNLRMCHCFG